MDKAPEIVLYALARLDRFTGGLQCLGVEGENHSTKRVKSYGRAEHPQQLWCSQAGTGTP